MDRGRQARALDRALHGTSLLASGDAPDVGASARQIREDLQEVRALLHEMRECLQIGLCLVDEKTEAGSRWRARVERIGGRL